MPKLARDIDAAVLEIFLILICIGSLVHYIFKIPTTLNYLLGLSGPPSNMKNKCLHI